jgi:hypothetical protein
MKSLIKALNKVLNEVNEGHAGADVCPHQQLNACLVYEALSY